MDRQLGSVKHAVMYCTHAHRKNISLFSMRACVRASYQVQRELAAFAALGVG